MIPQSTYYSLVEASTNVIVTKGSKKTLLKMKKKMDKVAVKGAYYIAITSQPVGESFK